MELFFGSRKETAFLLIILGLLAINSITNAAHGFSLAVFLLTVPPSAFLAIIAPRAGFAGLLISAIWFERFFTLEPIVISGHLMKMYPLDVFMIAVAAGAFVLAWKTKRITPELQRSGPFLLIFFCWVSILFALGLLTSAHENAALAFSAWKNYVFYGSFAFLTIILFPSPADIRMLVKYLLMGTFLASAFLFLGLLRGGGLWTEFTPLSTNGIRFLAFPHAFYFSLSIIVLLTSLPLWLPRAQKSLQWITGLALTFWTAGVLGSLMRHLWLGLAASGVLAFLMIPKRLTSSFGSFAKKNIFPILLGITLLIGAFMLPQTSSLFSSFLSFKDRVTSIGSVEDTSAAWRLVVWKEALKKFATSPLTGIGLDQGVNITMGDYHAFVEIRNMHNSWLAILVQTGAIGAAALLMEIVFLTFRAGKKVLRGGTAKELAVTLLTLIAFYGFIFNFQPYLETNLFSIFFWFTLGCGHVIILSRAEAPQKADAA